VLWVSPAGCSGSHERGHAGAGSARSNQGASASAELPGPAFGLTEDNAGLLWSPVASADGRVAPSSDPAFVLARERLTALRPSYLRLLVGWAALQPEPGHPPDLAAEASGCARAVGPCEAYAGLREEFAAIASQQRAAREHGRSEFQVVLQIFGTPAWAAHAPAGCELDGATPFSRPIDATGLDGYRALIRALLALGRQQGVELNWWSPWNEPNSAVYLSPQRATCTAASPSLAPAVYAQLARAMSAELQAAGGDRRMLLGELAAYDGDSPHRTSIASFVAGLPPDVICLSEAWSIHLYATRRPASAVDPLAAFEAALDSRGACGRAARVWITEAGSGAPVPGRRRPPSSADERASCLALAQALLDWSQDPRVAAVFQYSFREDPDYPVGLVSADLSHVYPAYHLWLAYTRTRARGALPDSSAGLCP
jgi:hypothetical protein